MMGNENSSHLSGLEIDNKAIEVSDSWTLHSATVNSGITPRPTLSIFISGLLQGGESTLPLELTAKNLMLHRHPYVLKYVSSWKKNGKHHLATEEVIPLSHVLNKLTPLQICIGLHSILKALIFLHEKALSSHNNVCCAAIYVTPDGTWKLGGLEYLCPFMKLTVKHLQQMKGRYEKAIPPEAGAGKTTPAAIDTFGFGVLVEEVLRGQVGDCVPALAEFREVCRINLQNHSPAERPPLTNLLSHQFLTHDFITIHNFLLELPLKTETEKQTFFRSLSDDLSHFPEELVASQLGGLLLSRLVLLDQTAQQYIFPQVITPKNDEVSFGLFSVETYRLHLVPRLLQMMCVRDAQIRLLLLTHFSVLCRAFTTDQLRTHVLPELLVGIKDTNDHLVSVTLHALADLVPMLGAATVIGGKRGKLFTDGRPKAHCTSVRKSPLRIPSINKHAVSSEPNLRSFANNLPERPSPDGGEDQLPTTDEETEAWSDWDENHASHVDNTFTNVEPNTSVEEELGNNDEIVEVSEINVLEIKTSSRNSLPDISTLDIKHSTSTSSKNKDEIDFFEDMVPVISKTLFTHISEQDELKPVNGAASKGRFDITTEDDADGWGDDLDDWGEVSEPISATATTS